MTQGVWAFGGTVERVIERAARLSAMGDCRGAARVLVRAVGDELDNPWLVGAAARALARDGQLRRSERYFRHALKLAPEDWETRIGYATVVGRLGRVAESCAALELIHDQLERVIAEGEHRFGLAATAWLGSADLALARFELLSGELAEAAKAERRCVRWLMDADGWEEATSVFIDAVEIRDGDVMEEARGLLDSGVTSPGLVALLLHDAVIEQNQPMRGLEVVLQAVSALAFPWVDTLAELPELLSALDHALRRAVMRGTCAPTTYERFVGLRAHVDDRPNAANVA